MKLFIKNKLISLSGSSKVLDENGNIVFLVKGSTFSIRRKKRVCSPDGKVLFIVKNRLFNVFTHKAHIYDADKNKLATVKNKFFSIDFEVEDCKDDIIVQGHWFRQADIVKNNQIVGNLIRSYKSMTDLFRDSFLLDVRDGNDAFWVAFVIAVDNIVDNRKN